MANIRPVGEIAAKWSSVTPQRTPDYERGVSSPRTPWAAATGNANQAWKDGVAAAATGDRFARGVARAGDARWSRGATTKGVQRWGPGVQGATADYEAGFAPFQRAIASLTLPPRFARRDPRNLLRVASVVAAMIAAAGGTAGR